MKKYIIFILLFSFQFLNAQRQDYQWVFANDGLNDIPTEPFGNFIMSFHSEVMNMKRFITEAIIHDSNSIISSSDGGKIVLYSNACRVFGSDHRVLNGLEEINRDSYWWRGDGHLLNQGILCIDNPGFKNQIICLYFFEEAPKPNDFVQCNILRASLVNISSNNTPTILFKDKDLYKADFNYGELTATRHANGRDWWIPIPKKKTKEVMVFLLDPTGLKLIHTQNFELPSLAGQGIGQACFSPDGTKYVMGNIDNFRVGGYVELFDFDRCSGLLMNKRNIFVSDSTNFGGLAFSPNCKYLYFATQFAIYRSLSNSINPELDKQRIDTFRGLKSDPFRCSFNKMQLGPDGKIYMASAGSNRCMSVVNFPDKDSLNDIGWSQNGIVLPTYNFRSIPNIPNYRLGPIDGTICDSLGMNNVPLARFRYTQDSSNYLNFEFTNLSSFEAKNYSWNFGDGNNSILKDPIHQYLKQGIYQVCLKASNEFGEDTQCKEINIGPNSSYNYNQNAKVDLWQLGEELIIQIQDYYPKHLILQVLNLQGQIIIEQRIHTGIQNISIAKLPTGIYFYQLADEALQMSRGKFLKE